METVTLLSLQWEVRIRRFQQAKENFLRAKQYKERLSADLVKYRGLNRTADKNGKAEEAKQKLLFDINNASTMETAYSRQIVAEESELLNLEKQILSLPLKS